ncbi:MAG: hypothetical protein M1459_00005 [Patescibacteria group bacterium]|nr:hypothetical protein [Patescibacteria group bacterium]
MTNTHTYKGIAWLDLESPDDNEIANVVRRYGLHALVGEELKTFTSLAKIDVYDAYVVVVLTLPIREKNGDSYEVNDREVDFVIGKNFLISSHFGAIEQLQYFAKIFEANSILGKDDKVEGASHLFYYMIKRIYTGMYEDLDNIRDALLSAEKRIFRGDEQKMVRTLSNVSRELIDFKQTARVHKDVWDSFTVSGTEHILGAEFAPYVHDLKNEFNRIHELITNCRELLADLRETNDSLLNAKQNQIIKALTIMAFIFQPLVFISALFTIPAINVPIIRSFYGWFGILGSMIILTAIIWTIIRRKRWI